MVEAWIQKEEEIQKVSNTRGVQSAPPYHVVQFEESKMNDVEALEAISKAIAQKELIEVQEHLEQSVLALIEANNSFGWFLHHSEKADLYEPHTEKDNFIKAVEMLGEHLQEVTRLLVATKRLGETGQELEERYQHGFGWMNIQS